MTGHIAIVDDEARMAAILAMVLERDGHRVETFVRPEAALAALENASWDVLLTDLKMPGIGGLELLERARHRRPDLPVILITAHGTVKSAVEAMQSGAFDYLQKPIDNDECRAVVRRALRMTRLERENRYLRSELKTRYSLDGVIAESPAMQGVFDLARRAAPSLATVLITGESGTGKELVARAIHVHSNRVARPFVAVNCKAFAGGVLESELFGHERGAFTGAASARPGLFERAAGGTVFLDEIGEIDDAFQAKLLRVLQERQVRRVGGNEERPVDVRIVAATNRDLKAEVDAGRFRDDLYFRLAVIPIHIPPLRERPADVMPLARLFVTRHSERQGGAHDGGHKVTGWDDDVAHFLRTHDWPGNVRELENTLERGVVLARGTTLTADDLMVTAPGRGPDPRGTLQDAIDHATATAIRTALAETDGKRALAADRLGIERTTLYRLMKRLEIR